MAEYSLLRGLKLQCRDVNLFSRFWDFNDAKKLDMSLLEDFSLVNNACNEPVPPDGIESIMENIGKMNLVVLGLDFSSGFIVDVNISPISLNTRLVKLSLHDITLLDSLSSALSGLTKLKDISFDQVQLQEKEYRWKDVFNTFLSLPMLKRVEVVMVGYTDGIFECCDDCCPSLFEFCSKFMEDILVAREIKSRGIFKDFPDICPVIERTLNEGIFWV